MIKIECYGQTTEYPTKQKAIEFFMDCFMACDPQSSEAGRYMYIVQEIMAGKKNITDRNY